ncbi:hypothetical protein [Actinospongicola halichondriae]|uniref:hypothetical protein n=1 Tax=Actinospongicola halichondriae TaxID=3236844 RepID=UPI003D4ED515
MRKTAAAAAMAASLTIGGGAGAVLFAPNLVGAQTDDTTTDEGATDEADRPEQGAFLEEALAPLVDAGTIDQGQADAVIAAIEEARPEGFGGHGRHHGRHVASEAVTDLLGMDAAELRELLADGQTLAEVGEANGVSVDDLAAALVSEMEERIAGAVEDGKLTQEEADEKLADATDRATATVNGERPERPEGARMGGPGEGRRGPGGPADDATDDTADDTTGS